MSFQNKKKKAINVESHYIIFYFNEEKNGYELEGYRPSMTEIHFRMRSLIFLFNRLHNHVNGFKVLVERKEKSWLRKKAIASFLYFLLFILPSLLAA